MGRCTPEAIAWSQRLYAAIPAVMTSLECMASGLEFYATLRTRIAAKRKYESSILFELATEPIMAPHCCIGNVTYVTATTDVHMLDDRLVDRAGRDAAAERVRQRLATAIEAAVELSARADGGRMPTSALLRETQSVWLDRGILDRLRLATLEHAFRRPDERAYSEALLAQIDRAQRTGIPTGRGELTNAAQRVLGRAEPSMILGAMSTR